MEKKLVIIQDGMLFPQRINAFESLKLEIITREFLKNNFQIINTTFEKIVNRGEQITDSYIFYASSQIPERKAYIDDVLYYLNMPINNNILLPKYEIFKCHENKGFQELYKNMIGLKSLNGTYHIDKQENNEFPFVLKLLEGYGSRSVCLVKNSISLKKIYHSKVVLKNKYLLLKHYLRSFLGRNTKEKKNYEIQLQTRRYITQPFVPNLEYDYKVLVFFEKVYVLKRYVKKNDFRASGSGLWEFTDDKNVPKAVLDFSYSCYEKLDLPFVSLDICSDEKQCYLIEFQGNHFGPVTLLNSKGYFDYNQSWNFITKTSDLEIEIANSLLAYIQKKK